MTLILTLCFEKECETVSTASLRVYSFVPMTFVRKPNNRLQKNQSPQPVSNLYGRSCLVDKEQSARRNRGYELCVVQGLVEEPFLDCSKQPLEEQGLQHVSYLLHIQQEPTNSTQNIQVTLLVNILRQNLAEIYVRIVTKTHFYLGVYQCQSR